MDVLFLDANVLFSAAYRRRSGLLRLWRLAKKREVQLVTSSFALAEAQRNLEAGEQRTRLEKLIRNVHVVANVNDHSLPPGIELPEKDRPILLAALAASATHLLTGNFQHFGRHFDHRFDGMVILPPAGYLRLHQAATSK